jgi:hypothetical protein
LPPPEIPEPLGSSRLSRRACGDLKERMRESVARAAEV